MDRIILSPTNAVLQKEPIRQNGKVRQYVQVTIPVHEQSETTKAKIAELFLLLNPLFEKEQKPLPEEIFLVTQAISTDPKDNTISRTANCGLPVLTNYTEFQLKVVVKHYDTLGTYVEGADKLVTLVADDVDGEFSQIKGQIESGANLFELTKQMILLRDSPEGGSRFNV